MSENIGRSVGENYAVLNPQAAFRAYGLIGIETRETEFWRDVHGVLIKNNVTGPVPTSVEPSIETSPPILLPEELDTDFVASKIA